MIATLEPEPAAPPSRRRRPEPPAQAVKLSIPGIADPELLRDVLSQIFGNRKTIPLTTPAGITIHLTLHE